MLKRYPRSKALCDACDEKIITVYGLLFLGSLILILSTRIASSATGRPTPQVLNIPTKPA